MDSIKAFQFHNILKQAGFFISGIIMAKWGMATSEIGIYEYWMFFVTTISFFWVNGLVQEYLSRQKTKEKTNDLGLFLGSFLLLSIACILIVLIIQIAGFQLFKEVMPIGLLLLFILFHIPTYLIDNYLMVNNKVKSQVIYGIVSFLFQLLSIVIPIACGWGLKGIFIALVITAGIKFLYLLSLLNWERPGLDLILSWKLIVGAVPFIGYFVITGFSGLIDGWIVQIHYLDQSVFAIYKYGARDLPVITTLAFTLGTGLVINVARDKLNAFEDIKKRSLNLMHICFPIAGVLMLTSSWIFPNLLNPSFAASAVIFNIYLLILPSRLIYPQSILTGLGYSKFLFKNALIELFVNAIASLILFELIGLQGIAFGTVIANVFDKVNSAYYLHKKEGISIKQYIPLSIYLVYTVGLVILFVLSQFIK